MKNFEKFEKYIVSQKAVLIRDGKVLIVEFTNKKMGWDIPVGRGDKGETSESAFRREIEEELGFIEFENLGVVDYDIWFTADNIPVCGIANLIRNDNDEVRLSPEHGDMRWIDEEDIDKYKYLWPELRRMIKKGFEKHKMLNKIKNKRLNEK